MLYIVFRGDLKRIYGVSKETRKKSKKTFKKSVDKWVPAWYYSQALERDGKKNERPKGLSEKAGKSA